METEKLSILLAVLETGSLSAAAEQRGYTPSAVSRSVAALEEELGFPLLHRGRRGVTPTAACGRMLPHIRRILSAERQYRQEAAAILGLEQGSLTIGCAYGSYLPMISGLVAAFTRAHPGIRVELLEGSSTEMSRAILEGRADLCLISRREGPFDWLSLGRDPLLAVLPTAHPFAGAAMFPVARFAEEDFIDILPGAETDNSRLFQRLGIRPRTRFTSADTMAALSLVEAGLGVTLVNALLLERWQGRAAALPLDPPELVEIGIAIPSQDGASPAARAFLRLLKG